MDTLHVGTEVPLLGTTVPSTERKKNKRQIAVEFVARSFRFACDHIGIKRLSNAIERTERAIRYWRNGEKEPGATDLLLAARECKTLRSRIIAFLHVPTSRLHRLEAEIDAVERQADALAADATAFLARQNYEVGGWRRARLSALSKAFGLKFRRKRQQAGAEAA